MQSESVLYFGYIPVLIFAFYGFVWLTSTFSLTCMLWFFVGVCPFCAFYVSYSSLYMFSDRIIRRFCWPESPCLCLCLNNWSCKCSFIGSVAARKWNQGFFVKHRNVMCLLSSFSLHFFDWDVLYMNHGLLMFFLIMQSESIHVLNICFLSSLRMHITVSSVQRKSKLNHMELHLCSVN